MRSFENVKETIILAKYCLLIKKSLIKGSAFIGSLTYEVSDLNLINWGLISCAVWLMNITVTVYFYSCTSVFKKQKVIHVIVTCIWKHSIF